MPIRPMSSLLQRRILLLGGVIGPETSSDIIASLMVLDAEDQPKPIDLYINSLGGGVADAMAIIDAIRSIRSPVHTICIGQAVSTAAWVLAAGARNHRAATPNAIIMIRELPFRGADSGNDIEIYAHQALRESVNALFTEWTGHALDALPGDRFLTALEARTHGIIDQVIGAACNRQVVRSSSRLLCTNVPQTACVPAPNSAK